ncbi:hypothetical protein WDW86_18680 [Bdellovibrionota bacterium FG-2]
MKAIITSLALSALMLSGAAFASQYQCMGSVLTNDGAPIGGAVFSSSAEHPENSLTAVIGNYEFSATPDRLESGAETLTLTVADKRIASGEGKDMMALNYVSNRPEFVGATFSPTNSGHKSSGNVLS